jgi:formamidopyrimidine-DNA glycosylase
MPELAEVEYYRKQWDTGLGHRVTRVEAHEDARVFRGIDAKEIARALRDLRYRQSFARGKQMLFRFGTDAWIGLHLGMTGKLRAERLPFRPTRHDHLVIRLKELVLVLRDPRQFGRVQFHRGPKPPDWWTKISAAATEPGFTREAVQAFLARHRRLPIKGTLLLQSGFPGIGNWMADEILWQAGIAPIRKTGELSRAEVVRIWKTARHVCRIAMGTIGKDFSDPPRNWLFHERWSRRGVCPKHKIPLSCAVVAGRTTVWCQRCQRA